MQKFFAFLRTLWPRKIRARLILGIALVHLVLMSVFVADLVYRQYGFLRSQSREQTFSLVNDLAVNSSTYVAASDLSGLDRMIHSYMDFPHLEYAMILSPDNIVLSHTDPGLTGKKAADSVSLRISRELRSHILLQDNHILDVAAPILHSGVLIGWARVGISQDYIFGNLTTIIRNGIFYILAAIIGGVLVGNLIGSRLTRGLYKLISASERIRAGDRGQRAAPSGSSELNQLATAFNQMVDEIGSNESLLRNAFDFSAIGMAIASLEGRWTKLNRSLADMLGYEMDELINMDFRQVTHPDDLQKDLEHFGELRAGKIDRYVIDKRYLHRSGGIVWVHLTVSTVKDANNLPLFFVSQVEDISDVIESQMEARKRQSELESVFQNSEGAICLIDADRRYVIFNRKFIEDHRLLTGRDPVAGSLIYGDFSSAVAQKRMALLNKVMQGNKEVIEIDYLINGRRTYYRTSFNPVIVDGKVTGISTYSINLTENKEAELALRESEEKFRSLVEQSQVGVYILQDDKFVYVNPTFERLSGYSKEEILGKPFDLLIHEDDLALVRQSYELRASGERPKDNYVLRAIRRDGTIIFIEAIVSGIVYNNRPAAIGTSIDITGKILEENRINKAVIDAQEQERMQIGMELHDNVQQIMAGSLLTIDYIRSIYEDKDVAMETLANVRRYINEALLELRHISHQLAPSMSYSETLREKIESLVEKMNAAGRLEVDLIVDEFEFGISDELQLAFYRILQEQLTNIQKYAAASQVAIRVRLIGEKIALSIRDNGRGFDPATRKEGIGFENIKRRVAAMNGELKIHSALGEGCELSLQVPV
jgi:PAS domain S-box-containing protein